MRSIYLLSSLLLTVLATTETDQIVLTGIDCEVTNTRPLDWEGTHYGPSQGRDGGYGTTYADGRLFEFSCGSCQDSQGHTGSYVTCGYSWIDVKSLEYTDNQLVITDVITESRGNAVDSCQTEGYQTAFTYASTTARDTDNVKSDKFRICYKLTKWPDVIFDRLDIVTAISARSAISVMQSQSSSKYCSQDWDTDYALGQSHVTLDACKQSCVEDSTCTGISWSASHNNRCVKCHGPMQYAAHHAWDTFDKEAGDAPELPSFPGDFMWSWAGAIPGANCVWLGDWMGHWQDNFLCTSGDKADPGFRYSSAGPIGGMKCINIHEPSAPSSHTWADNYLCYPNDLPYELTWSYTGRIPGQDCIQVYEGHEYLFHMYWRDNFLCAPRTTVPDGASCNAKQLAKCTSFPCVDLRQDNEHHHIMTYTEQGKAKVIYYTNDFVASGRTWTCTCAGCEKKSLVGTWTCVNDADKTIMYESAITISADYADNFLPNQGNWGFLGTLRHLDVCKPVNLIGKFDTYNDVYANMCGGNPYSYCNSYSDLKRDFCGGATCTESTTATCTFANSVYDCCKTHFENWGKAEIEAGTRAPPTCEQWTVIDGSKACYQNSEGISQTFGAYGFNFETCKARCIETAGCKAIDFYRYSGWCSLFDTACSTPMTTWDGASSWRRTDVTHGAPPGCSSFFEYCNEYNDLKNAFCGGQTCTAANNARCRQHWNQFGETEGRKCQGYVPKAYGDDTHPANFVSLFTHKAEADVGPLVIQPKVIGLWRKRAYDRSDIMDTNEVLTLRSSSSQSTTMEETEYASWNTLSSHTHHAEVAVEASASYGIASGSLSALYSYEYEHERSQTFESQVRNLANTAFNQQIEIKVPIIIPMKDPSDKIETVNVWYYETTVIGQATSGSGLASATQFIISDRKTTYGCGHHIPPNCLPGYCDPDDHNCWECTTQWAQIDPTFRRPLQCEEEGEGGEFVKIQESECPPYSEIRNLPPCNESTGCGDMCEADGPMPGWPGTTHQIDNCYGAYDVFRWTCPWTQ